jgi:hypothetical protein
VENYLDGKIHYDSSIMMEKVTSKIEISPSKFRCKMLAIQPSKMVDIIVLKRS